MTIKSALLIILCLGFAGTGAIAQRIRFTDTSNIWTMVAFTSDPSSNPASARYVRDPVIGGMRYHRLTIDGPGVLDTIAVREDTLDGKIHFRFLATDYRGIQTDSLERVLFDNRLSISDTLKVAYAADTFLHVVEGLDSVQLGADFYHHWVMHVSSSSGVVGRYEFIEGVGTNQSPVNFIFHPGLVPAQYQLRCFWNNGIKPLCKPAVYVPFGFYKPKYPWEPIPVDSFDNAVSCSFKYVGVPSMATTIEPVFSPSPGGKEISMSLPDAVSSARLHITDITGRTVLQRVISTHKTNIGQYLSTPGVYYYTLQDAVTGQRYTGRFIFH